MPNHKGSRSNLQDWLAQIVRDHLRVQGLTQRELAATAGITEKHLCMILLGKQMGSLAIWDAVLKAVGAWPLDPPV